jgi:hypothetical protein
VYALHMLQMPVKKLYVLSSLCYCCPLLAAASAGVSLCQQHHRQQEQAVIQHQAGNCKAVDASK